MKLKKINEQWLETERDLIFVLLTYPNQANKVLAAHQQMLNPGLIQMMEQIANRMAVQGSTEAADFLQNLAAQLKQEIASLAAINKLEGENYSPTIVPKKFNKFIFLWSGTILLLFSFLIFLTRQSNSEPEINTFTGKNYSSC